MSKGLNFYLGCLLGGAVGDSLGWPIETMSFDEIKDVYGEVGILDLTCKEGNMAEIKDTQMALFTAEGLINSIKDESVILEDQVMNQVYISYLRWLYTQERPLKTTKLDIYKDGLIDDERVYNLRRPGKTSIRALKSGRAGTILNPINKSKGCGAVMRNAPVGLFFDSETAFDLGNMIACITHCHPAGYLSAGAFSLIISEIIEGYEVERAVETALEKLVHYKGNEEVEFHLRKALELAKSAKSVKACLLELGEGWLGEEALAIGVFCALRYKNDFSSAVLASVNHSGDSDSTGIITGSILGASLGIEAVPECWTSKLEMKDLIEKMAIGLFENTLHK